MDLPPTNVLFVPPEAFQFWPQGADVVRGSKKQVCRLVFYRVEFTQYERESLQELKQVLSKQHADLQLLPYYTDEELLRLLLANRFNLKKTVHSLNEGIQWRLANLTDGYLSFYSRAQPLLTSGCIYVQGRDHKYRPLLVINLPKFDLKTYCLDDYVALLCFTLEFMLKHLMLPGQVENWVVVTDLGNVPLRKLPISDLKVIIKVLQNNYRCRMLANYVVNAPSSIAFVWKVVKGLLDEHTVKKIRIGHKAVPAELFEHTAKNQVEEKYGGSFSNRTEFWPLCLPSAPYHIEGEDPHTHLSNYSSYPEYFPEPQDMPSIDSESVAEEFIAEQPRIQRCHKKAEAGNQVPCHQDVLSEKLSLEYFDSPEKHMCNEELAEAEEHSIESISIELGEAILGEDRVVESIEEGSIASEGKPCTQVVSSNSAEDNDPFYIKGLDQRAIDEHSTQCQPAQVIQPKKARSVWSYLCFCRASCS